MCTDESDSNHSHMIRSTSRPTERSFPHLRVKTETATVRIRVHVSATLNRSEGNKRSKISSRQFAQDNSGHQCLNLTNKRIELDLE